MGSAEIVSLVTAALGLLAAGTSAYVTLSTRALVAELRLEMAQLEQRIVDRINGTYVRREVLDARLEAIRK
jgi:hypothetical protein